MAGRFYEARGREAMGRWVLPTTTSPSLRASLSVHGEGLDVRCDGSSGDGAEAGSLGYVWVRGLLRLAKSGCRLGK